MLGEQKLPDPQMENILHELRKMNDKLEVIAKALRELPAAMPSDPDFGRVESLLDKIAENTAPDD